MGVLCTCPVGSALTAITIDNCPENMGQIQKFIFQRYYSTGTTRNTFVVASADPDTLASWTAVKGASDGTKVVVTPFVNNPTSEGGDPIEFGGGNATVGGTPVIVGRNATVVTAEFHNIKQYTTAQNLKELQCEYIGVYMVDEFGRIWGTASSASSPTNFYPIRIVQNTFFIGDKQMGGFEAPDMNVIRFALPPNWSDDLYVVTPSDFDALVDL